MTIQLHLMDRGQPLNPTLRDRVLDPIQAAVRTIATYVPAFDADLVIIPTDIYTHPRWYRSGKAYGPGYAQIEFNPAHPRFDTEWDREAGALVLHELHHCLRWPHVARWTVGEVIVLEGLAMLAEGVDGFLPMDQGDPPPDPILTELCYRAFAVRWDEESAATSWFRNTSVGGTVFDAPVNYHIGKAMMAKALTALDLDPFSAANRPAETLLQAWAATAPQR